MTRGKLQRRMREEDARGGVLSLYLSECYRKAIVRQKINAMQKQKLTRRPDTKR